MFSTWHMPNEMLPLLAAVLSASLLGSAHCAGMCGAFVAIAVNPGQEPAAPSSRFARAITPTIAYNLGRLVTYLVFGALAGATGAMVDLGGSMLGLQQAAALGAAVFMIAFACLALLAQSGVRVGRVPVPGFLLKLAKRGHHAAFALSPCKRAAVIGLLTTLLPCGWLYAFVIISAGTAHPIAGMLTMLAFWAGTLPIMATLGLGLHSLAGPLRRHLPLVSTLAVLVIGIWTLIGRFNMPEIKRDAAFASVIQADGQGPSTQALQEATRHADKVCPLCHPQK